MKIRIPLDLGGVHAPYFRPGYIADPSAGFHADLQALSADQHVLGARLGWFAHLLWQESVQGGGESLEATGSLLDEATRARLSQVLDEIVAISVGKAVREQMPRSTRSLPRKMVQ